MGFDLDHIYKMKRMGIYYIFILFVVNQCLSPFHKLPLQVRILLKLTIMHLIWCQSSEISFLPRRFHNNQDICFNTNNHFFLKNYQHFYCSNHSLCSNENEIDSFPHNNLSNEWRHDTLEPTTDLFDHCMLSSFMTTRMISNIMLYFICLSFCTVP